ncbi:hypothetical protein DPMN_109800 [Dreissena polymorpha]|uniref:Uncharacterized protein n=2 Tax=Dreissena polymorpha TaxID=45954 RepID=A0A9D4QND4_DREPO|nr:hypothetical protein DPMN_109800 [Dreissena polymorpha]
MYSTVRKKQICVPEQSGVSFEEDPLYSVVEKKNKGPQNHWNTTDPPASICSISAMPLYSKVKKKNRNVVDTDDTTDSNS